MFSKPHSVVRVPNPLAPEASEAGNLSKADLQQSCPTPAKTLGGLHCLAIEQIKNFDTVLGQGQRYQTRHLFQRLSLLLMRRNDDSDLNAAV